MQRIVSKWSSVSFSYILTKKEEYFEISSKDKVGILITGENGNFSIKISNGHVSGRCPGKVGDKLNIIFKNDTGNDVIVNYKFFVKRLGFIDLFKRLFGV